MNKYMGFYELNALSIPSVPWKIFTSDTVLDDKLLWTVRVATAAGDDLNLPRAVGVDSEEALVNGRRFLREYGRKGIVLYYPYFIAEKSGVLDINSQRLVIEAVDRDLWNLVTYGRKDVTMIVPADKTGETDDAGGHSNGSIKSPDVPGKGVSFGSMQITGNSGFLTPEEIRELMRYSAVIRGRFREEISGGASVLAEWSYAYNTDIHRRPIGDRYLVFYELRELPAP
ncbi:MAG: hypothetical protein QM236_06345 [Bacillota bacterium]|jgi:hypothetical protein|nr:hypothetical protein [Bacillota bacterium]